MRRKRTCPKCNSEKTMAVVNDFREQFHKPIKSMGYWSREVLAGCSCKDCGAVWEAWDNVKGAGEPFNVKSKAPLFENK